MSGERKNERKTSSSSSSRHRLSAMDLNRFLAHALNGTTRTALRDLPSGFLESVMSADADDHGEDDDDDGEGESEEQRSDEGSHGHDDNDDDSRSSSDGARPVQDEKAMARSAELPLPPSAECGCDAAPPPLPPCTADVPPKTVTSTCPDVTPTPSHYKVLEEMTIYDPDLWQGTSGPSSFSPEELVCGICKFICRNPTTTSCGHLYCEPCISRSLEASNLRRECPMCRAPVDKVSPCPFLGRHIATRPIQCPSCPVFRGDVKSLSEHMTKCPERVLVCSKCSTHVVRKHAATHDAEECTKRPRACTFCETVCSSEAMSRHVQEECTEVLIPCPSKCCSVPVVPPAAEAASPSLSSSSVVSLSSSSSSSSTPPVCLVRRRCLADHLAYECPMAVQTCVCGASVVGNVNMAAHLAQPDLTGVHLMALARKAAASEALLSAATHSINVLKRHNASLVAGMSRHTGAFVVTRRHWAGISSLRVGDVVDAKETRQTPASWHLAEVEETVDQCHVRSPGSEPCVKVRFIGWSTKWNTDLRDGFVAAAFSHVGVESNKPLVLEPRYVRPSLLPALRAKELENGNHGLEEHILHTQGGWTCCEKPERKSHCHVSIPEWKTILEHSGSGGAAATPAGTAASSKPSTGDPEALSSAKRQRI